MKKPSPLSKDKLRHPKDKRSSFNGDKWRNNKKDNYMTRVSSVEGTRRPSNIKEIAIAHLTPEGSVEGRKDRTGAIQPVPSDHIYGPAFLKQHQQLMKHRSSPSAS